MAKVYYIAGVKPQMGLLFKGQPITAQSQPVLDGWGWGDYWGCAEWQAWHAELLKVMTPAQAAQTFTQAWNSQDSFANPYNWCKYNSDFRNYMRANGINIDSVVSAIVMPIFDTAGNIAQGTGTVITNAVDTAGTLSTILKYAIPVALVGGVVYLATNSKARNTAAGYAKRAISGTKKRSR